MAGSWNRTTAHEGRCAFAAGTGCLVPASGGASLGRPWQNAVGEIEEQAGNTRAALANSIRRPHADAQSLAKPRLSKGYFFLENGGRGKD